MRKIIALLMLVLMYGCGGGDEPTTLPQEDIFKGKDGIEIEFLKDTPPRTIYHDRAFSIGVTMKNIGAADIRNGIIALSVEEDYVVVTQEDWFLPEEDSITTTSKNTADFSLRGRDPSYPEGDMLTFSIQASANELEGQSIGHTVDVILMACYDYETKLSADVCIDYDIYDEKQGGTCKPKDQTFSAGQGAPVAVVSIEPELLPQEAGGIIPSYLIKVKNVADGYPFTRGKSDYVCSNQASSGEFNEVDISAQLGGVDLVCSPSSTLKLRDKQDYARCQTTAPWYQQDASQSTFHTSLVVKLSYGYMNSVARSVEIKRFPD